MFNNSQPNATNHTRKLSIAYFEPWFDPEEEKWLPGADAHTEELSWTEIVAGLSKWDVTDNKGGVLLYHLCEYGETKRRSKDNVTNIHGLMLDYDGGQTIQQFMHDWSNLEYFLATSFSHQSNPDKFRVIIPFTEPLPARYMRLRKDTSTDEECVQEAITRCFSGIDLASLRVSQCFYLPSHPQERKHLRFHHHNHGEWLDWRCFLEKGTEIPYTPPTPPTSVNTTIGGSGRIAYSTFDVVQWAQDAGIYIKAGGGAKHFVRCPFHFKHGNETQTAIFSGEPRGFKCLHANCSERTIKDIRALAGDRLREYCETEKLSFQIPWANDEGDADPEEPQVTDDYFFPGEALYQKYPLPDLVKIFDKGTGAHLIIGCPGQGKSVVANQLADAGYLVVFGSTSNKQSEKQYQFNPRRDKQLMVSHAFAIETEFKVKPIMLQSGDDTPWSKSHGVDKDATARKLKDLKLVPTTKAGEQAIEDCKPDNTLELDSGIVFMTSHRAHLMRLSLGRKKNVVLFVDDPAFGDVCQWYHVSDDIQRWLNREEKKGRTYNRKSLTFGGGIDYVSRPSDQRMWYGYSRVVVTTCEAAIYHAVPEQFVKQYTSVQGEGGKRTLTMLAQLKERLTNTPYAITLHDLFEGKHTECITYVYESNLVWKKTHAVFPLFAKEIERLSGTKTLLIGNGMAAGINHLVCRGRNDLSRLTTLIEISQPNEWQTYSLVANIPSMGLPEARLCIMIDQFNQSVGRNQGERHQGLQTFAVVPPGYMDAIRCNCMFLTETVGDSSEAKLVQEALANPRAFFTTALEHADGSVGNGNAVAAAIDELPLDVDELMLLIEQHAKDGLPWRNFKHRKLVESKIGAGEARSLFEQVRNESLPSKAETLAQTARVMKSNGATWRATSRKLNLSREKPETRARVSEAFNAA